MSTGAAATAGRPRQPLQVAAAVLNGRRIGCHQERASGTLVHRPKLIEADLIGIGGSTGLFNCFNNVSGRKTSHLFWDRHLRRQLRRPRPGVMLMPVVRISRRRPCQQTDRGYQRPEPTGRKAFTHAQMWCIPDRHGHQGQTIEAKQ